MFNTLITIAKDNWQWRSQIFRLSLFEFSKQTQGTALGWIWTFVRPMLQLVVFWIALQLGLRQGGNAYPPYILWLMAGFFPWFFMREMLGAGSNVFNRYSYLVKRIRFPISGIPTFHLLSLLYVHFGLIAVLLILHFAFGLPFDLYLLQIPFIMLVMALFFHTLSMLTSFLSALSKDFVQFLKAFTTVLMWLSGIIYNIDAVSNQLFHKLILFNPVTFFVEAYRAALYNKVWIWEKPEVVLAFCFVFLVTLVVMLVVYKRLRKEVPDAL